MDSFYKDGTKGFRGYFAADNGISEVKSSVWLSEEREGFVLACSEVWFREEQACLTRAETSLQPKDHPGELVVSPLAH